MNMTLKEKMRTVAIDHFGGPEVLSIRNLPVPEVKPDQILIRVKSAGVGIWDVAERQGMLADRMEKLYGVKSSFPYVIGSEGAGTVTAVGDKVRNFRIDDRVYSHVWARDPKAGFYAEYTAADAKSSLAVPTGLTIEQAGALFIDGAVAIRELDDILQLKPNEKLIIFGASGGIGHLAVQLAKRMGAQVFAVASQEDGVALAKRLGADVVVDGHNDDIIATAREFAPSGFDAALITVRGQNPDSIKAVENALTTMRNGGRVAFPWWLNSNMPTLKVSSGVQLLPFTSLNEGEDALMSKLNRLVEAGSFEVHLGKTFSLDQVVDAQQALYSHYLGRMAILP
jgi:NADPH:quinone reductase